MARITLPMSNGKGWRRERTVRAKENGPDGFTYGVYEGLIYLPPARGVHMHADGYQATGYVTTEPHWIYPRIPAA